MPLPMPKDADASDVEHKSIGGFEVKDESKGEVTAIVATLGVMDKDGDVIYPGAFPAGAKVKLSAYGHDVILDGAPPVGKGTITEMEGKAIFEGNFFMSTARGREAFETTKALGPDGEWSFGFRTSETKTLDMTPEWKAEGARRLISWLNPIEASPVFQGAGMGTGTLSAKGVTQEEKAAASLNPSMTVDMMTFVETARVRLQQVENSEELGNLQSAVRDALASLTTATEMAASMGPPDYGSDKAEEEAAEAKRQEATRLAEEAAAVVKAQQEAADRAEAEAELKAAEAQALQDMASNSLAEYERVHRTLKRMGLI
jgi:hypothetical protein